MQQWWPSTFRPWVTSPIDPAIRREKGPRGLAAGLRGRLSSVALCVSAVVACGLPGIVAPAAGQSLSSVRTSARPLTLKSRGSFFVGGEPAQATAAELGLGPADVVTVNQMYVEFMVPTGRTRLPIVLVHGAGLSGKSYDTTPDGRMGWFEYFVRKSHPTYVVDQVGRARSGFNHILLNRRVAGEMPGTTGPAAFRFGEKAGVWTNFRFGPRFGETFAGSQFPTEAIAELAKQAIPDMTPLVPTPNPTFKALSDLAKELNGAVLLSHSQSGPFPMDAALIDATGIRAIVSVEPGTCRGTYTDDQIARLAKVPTLILFGDHLPVSTGMSTAGATAVTWQTRFDGCGAYAARIKAAGGKVELLKTTDLGIQGNSHMLMQDRNSDQIADLILKWINKNAL